MAQGLLEDLAARVAEVMAEIGRADPVEAPGLEAAALRAFLAEAPVELPPIVVIRLWRDLTAAQRLPFSLAVWGGTELARLVALARLRFGAAAPLAALAKPEAALAAAKDPGVVAVLALDKTHAWWGRLLAEPRLKVFA